MSFLRLFRNVATMPAMVDIAISILMIDRDIMTWIIHVCRKLQTEVATLPGFDSYAS